MANWLVTVNYAEFDLEAAYEILPVIHWKNSTKSEDKGLQINDVVYVYVTGDTAKVMYKLQVIAQAENSEYPLAQKAFWKDKSKIESYSGGFSILQGIKKIDKSSLTRRFFLEQAFISKDNTLQGRRTDRNKHQDDPIRKLLDHISSQFVSEVKKFDYPDEANLDNPSFPEGARKTVQVNTYERNPEARAKCIEVHGTRCKICEMSFAKTYGLFAKDFIHVHHIKPLKDINEEYEVDPINDLIPVCPNCHAMLHRQENGMPVTIEKLKLLFEASKKNN